MPSEISRLVSKIESSRYSTIGRDIEVNDVSKVWEQVGVEIRDSLLKNIDVIVPGVGIFFLYQTKTPALQFPIKYIFNQSPRFQVSAELAIKYNLRRNYVHTEGIRPFQKLNLSKISWRCGVERVKVGLCLKEITTFVERNCAEQLPFDLPIIGVGVLKFRGRKVKMLFSDGFLPAIEEIDCLVETKI